MKHKKNIYNFFLIRFTTNSARVVLLWLLLIFRLFSLECIVLHTFVIIIFYFDKLIDTSSWLWFDVKWNNHFLVIFVFRCVRQFIKVDLITYSGTLARIILSRKNKKVCISAYQIRFTKEFNWFSIFVYFNILLRNIINEIKYKMHLYRCYDFRFT